MPNEFSVCQFFADGTSEYIKQWVSAEEAVATAKAFTETIGAKIGATQRIIITDGGDCVAFEWKCGEGVVYPPQN